MRKYILTCILVVVLSTSCRNLSDKKANADGQKADSGVIANTENPKKPANNVNPTDNQISKLKTPGKEAKSVEVEIINLNTGDTTHKMSLFLSDRKYFHSDSLYCELVYKLKEVQKLAKERNPDGDYVSMMIDDRPQSGSNYFQIALYRIRTKLDKMDRLESYRIDTKTKHIEKHDVVKDKWVLLKE